MQSEIVNILDIAINLIIIIGASILTMTLTHILLSVRSNRFATEICCALGFGVYIILDILLGTFEMYRILIAFFILTPVMIIEVVRPSTETGSNSIQLVESVEGGIPEDALCFSWKRGFLAITALEGTGFPFSNQVSHKEPDSDSSLKSLYPLWIAGERTKTVYTIEITLQNGLARYYLYLINHHKNYSTALENVRKARHTATRWFEEWNYEFKILDSRQLWKNYKSIQLEETDSSLDHTNGPDVITITEFPTECADDLSGLVNSLLDAKMIGRLQISFKSMKSPILKYSTPESSDQNDTKVPFKVEDHHLRDIYKQIAEIEACEETGAFKCNILAISETESDEIFSVIQSIWPETDVSKIPKKYLRRTWDSIQTRQYFVSKSNTISGATLSALLQMSEPVPGLPNRIVPPKFALPRHNLIDDHSVQVGRVLNSGKITEQDYTIPVNAFCFHTGIYGNPGSGKTNTAMHIVTQLAEREIPFLIISPAKTEWRQLLNLLSDVRIFTVGDEQVAPFRYNFLIPPPNVSINTHINNIADCFIASWPSEGIITEHIIKIFRRAYDNAGWNRLTNERGEPILISDLYTAMEQVSSELSYGRLQQDFIGAHKSRFGSLLDDVVMAVTLNTEHGLTIPELLEHRTVIEIRNMNSSQVSLITSLITVAVAEYLESQPQGFEQEMKHLLVLEEAHHVLKRSTTSLSINEGHSSKQMAIDTIVNLLREARGLGLGLILIDQLPGEMADTAVKLPGITIIHQIKDPRERVLVGTQADLNKEQISHIGSLNIGEVIVHRNLDLHSNFAVNCQVSHCFDSGRHWKNEDIVEAMDSYYKERPYLLIQLLPSTMQWEPDPHILRKLLLLTESLNFLKNFKACLVLNHDTAASAYVREVVETMVQQPTEIDLYTTLIFPVLVRNMRGEAESTLKWNEIMDSKDSKGVEGHG